MKELIVFLSIFLSFGIEGQCDERLELLFIRRLTEIGLKVAKLRDYNGPQKFLNLTSGDDCIEGLSDLSVFYFVIEEVEKITKPINDWIVQTSKNVILMDTYLKQMGIMNIEDIYETDVVFDNKLMEPFLGECNLPFDNLPFDLYPLTEKRKRSINTNDLYKYRNLKNSEIESPTVPCGGGRWIYINRTCDGNLDCWDGSDEFGACEETAGCEQCSGSCVTGPEGPRCVASCPAGFGPPAKFCSSSAQCYSVCVRRNGRKLISLKCLLKIFPNLLANTNEKYRRLMSVLYVSYLHLMNKQCMEFLFWTGLHDDSMEGLYTTLLPLFTTPIIRHPSSHPTTRHPTWYPTTRHTTWHTTTRPTTWDPDTSKSIWDSDESDNSTQFDENKPYATKHHTTKHTTEHTTHHTTTPPTTTTTPTKSTTSPTTTTTTSD